MCCFWRAERRTIQKLWENMSWNGSKALVTFCRKIRDCRNKYAISAIWQILKAVLSPDWALSRAGSVISGTFVWSEVLPCWGQFSPAHHSTICIATLLKWLESCVLGQSRTLLNCLCCCLCIPAPADTIICQLKGTCSWLRDTFVDRDREQLCVVYLTISFYSIWRDTFI